MKTQVIRISFLFSILTIIFFSSCEKDQTENSKQDYFPIIQNSYWIYNVYYDGVFMGIDSVEYKGEKIINDTLFFKFVHTGIWADTFYLFHNKIDANAVMLSNRNLEGIVDSAVYAKHNYIDGDWWKYKNKRDSIKIQSIGDVSVPAGIFQNCFIQGEEYIFAPNVGIIKIYLWNSTSYSELIKYNIPY